MPTIEVPVRRVSVVSSRPFDGRVGTLLVAIVPHDFWVVANFKETQIPAMQTSDTVASSVDAIPGIAFRGRVESLSLASGAEFALLPPVSAGSPAPLGVARDVRLRR